ncbi:unnamed protein product [Owenia fusiformis]|uniref:Uncharacterized protein n=1 Tax=Owenia fusiformis TaxID=6347 RepID=A0A8J1XT47_OWEFU|nr:unnamed protein product [Owenia fusiformis]
MDGEVYIRIVLAVFLGTTAVRGQGARLCANIVFAFDTSCSISEETKEGAVEFMDDFVGLFDSIGDPSTSSTGRFTQFGLLAFDINSRKVFGFGEAPSKDDVINTIQEEFDTSHVDCKTITNEAIDMAIEDFFESGDQDDKSPNVLVLLTDARTQPQKFRDETIVSINRLRAKNNTYVFLLQLPNANEKTDFEDTIEQVNVLAEPENIFQYSEDTKQLAESVYGRMANIGELTCPGDEITCDESPLDILLILDHSNSVKPENIIDVRDAMKALVNTFKNVGDGDTSVKFALLTYNNKVTPEMLFNDTASSTREGTLKAIEDQTMARRKNTRTDLALEFANSVVFTPEAGDRKFAYNMIVLVTDGRTMKAKYQKFTFRAANALKGRTGDDEVGIFLLGLPGARAKNLDVQRKEWNEIPSEPKETHFKEFDKFDELLPFIQELSQRVCAVGLGF